MYISVEHNVDEQLEALDFLLDQEPFKQGSGDSPQSFEQLNGLRSSSGFQQELQNYESNQVSSVIEIRPDSQREQRKGVPEVIFGETKEIGQIITMARNILAESGRALISRVRPETVVTLRESFQTYTICVRQPAHPVAIYRSVYVYRSTGGHVGVISARASGIPVAYEPPFIADGMGCDVTCIDDGR